MPAAAPSEAGVAALHVGALVEVRPRAGHRASLRTGRGSHTLCRP